MLHTFYRTVYKVPLPPLRCQDLALGSTKRLLLNSDGDIPLRSSALLAEFAQLAEASFQLRFLSDISDLMYFRRSSLKLPALYPALQPSFFPGCPFGDFGEAFAQGTFFMVFGFFLFFLDLLEATFFFFPGASAISTFSSSSSSSLSGILLSLYLRVGMEPFLK